MDANHALKLAAEFPAARPRRLSATTPPWPRQRLDNPEA